MGLQPLVLRARPRPPRCVSLSRGTWENSRMSDNKPPDLLGIKGLSDSVKAAAPGAIDGASAFLQECNAHELARNLWNLRMPRDASEPSYKRPRTVPASQATSELPSSLSGLSSSTRLRKPKGSWRGCAGLVGRAKATGLADHPSLVGSATGATGPVAGARLESSLPIPARRTQTPS